MWRDVYPEPFPQRISYLYLRTKTRVEFADDVLHKLGKNLPTRVYLLELGEKKTTWENGFVLKIISLTNEGPRQIYEDIRENLDGFDAWAMFDTSGEFRESMAGGPLSLFFEQSENLGLSQIFLVGHHLAPRFVRAIDGLKTSLPSFHKPIFHFEDGQVIFQDSGESASITKQRGHRYFSSLDDWAVVDSSGAERQRAEDERLWTWIDPRTELSFEQKD